MEERDGRYSREGLGIHRLERLDTDPYRLHSSLLVYPCYKRVTARYILDIVCIYTCQYERLRSSTSDKPGALRSDKSEECG